MRYTLDGRLFAVGVVDILPRCLSSVYLFYDPSFAALSPGVLSAVKEIEWVQAISSVVPELEYYYMGYYIQTCPKMTYKAEFKPSEILCEETRHWVPAAVAAASLESAKSRTIRLAPAGVPPARRAANHDIPDDELDALVDESLVILQWNKAKPFKDVEAAMSAQSMETEPLRADLRQFIRLVGRDCAQAYVHMF
jgi:hypothetical protein